PAVFALAAASLVDTAVAVAIAAPAVAGRLAEQHAGCRANHAADDRTARVARGQSADTGTHQAAGRRVLFGSRAAGQRHHGGNGKDSLSHKRLLSLVVPPSHSTQRRFFARRKLFLAKIV